MENKKGRESKGEEGQERKEETIEKTWKTCLAHTHQDFCQAQLKLKPN